MNRVFSPRLVNHPLNTAANIPMRPPDRAQQRPNSARTAQNDGHGDSDRKPIPQPVLRPPKSLHSQRTESLPDDSIMLLLQ